jgi:hypothetical protein
MEPVVALQECKHIIYLRVALCSGHFGKWNRSTYTIQEWQWMTFFKLRFFLSNIWDQRCTSQVAHCQYGIYLQQWPHVCSVGHNDNPVLSSFMTYHRICGAEISFPFGAPAFNPEFSGVSVDRSFAFSVVFCRSLFALFLLTIVLSVFPVTASCYPFDIFKLSWCCSRTVAL